MGDDCAEVERSGTVPAGREWTLRVGDWVTWAGRTGEIVGHDGWTMGHVRVEFYDPRDGEPSGVVSLSKRHLRFAGTSMPDDLLAVLEARHDAYRAEQDRIHEAQLNATIGDAWETAS